MRFTGRIATLYDKILDNAVEQHPFILACLAELDEIVAMQRCIVIEQDGYVSHRGADRYINRLIRIQRLLCTGGQSQQRQTKQ